MQTKRVISTCMVERTGRGPPAALAMRPKMVSLPRPTTMPVTVPSVHKVPASAMLPGSRGVSEIRGRTRKDGSKEW